MWVSRASAILACLLAGMSPGQAAFAAAGRGSGQLRDQAEKLIARAREAGDLQAKENPAFYLKARVRALELREGPLEGSYLRIWSSPDHWRTEIRLGVYQEIAVGGPETIWHRRSLAYQPYRVYQLEQLLDMGQRLQIEEPENVVEIGEREWQGVRCTYLQTEMKGGGREFWFDPATGALLREKHDALENISAYEYADYVEVGQRLFPRSLRLLQFGKLVVEVRVEEVSVTPEPSAILFRPLEDAQPWPRCAHTSPPRPLKSPAPSYPWPARRSRATGVARAYVVVGPDGLVHYSSVVRTPGEDFSAAIQKILRRWRFRPASCRGEPVEFPVFVEFTFRTVARH